MSLIHPPRRPGRLAALAASTLLLAACAVPSLPGSAPAKAPVPGPTVPAVVVRREPIQQTVTYSGDVHATDQITVLPKASGRVAKVLVGVGTPVHAGDVIAQLEQDTPAIGLLQAQANLAAAQAKLTTVEAGGRPDDVAAAEEALAQQQARLASMQSQGRSEDVAAARAALAAQQAKLQTLVQGGRDESVAQAEAGLDAAQQKLALLQNGATEDVRQAAVSAVDADTANVVAAEAAYAALGGTAAADLQAAQSQVDTLHAQIAGAQSVVRSADAALANLKGSSVADVQQAQTAYDQAQAQLTAAQAALNQANNPTHAAVVQAQAVLAGAEAQHAAAESNQTALEQSVSGYCAPFPAGYTTQTRPGPGGSTTGVMAVIPAPANGNACEDAKNAANVAVDASNKAVESARAQLDLLQGGGAPAVQATLQAQVAGADALVRATRARLDALKTGGIEAQRAQIQSQRDQAQSALVAAQDSLTVADARLAAAKNGTLDAQRKASQAAVAAAREKLKADRARIEQIVAGPQDEEVRAAQDAVTQAEQAVALARQPATAQDIQVQRALGDQAAQQLRKAQQPYTEYDLEQQRHVVAQAEAQVRSRQNPYTDQDLQAANAGVEQAKAAVDLAQIGIKETDVTAPVDGIVADRQVSPGALVGPTSAIVTLVPPSLEVAVNVDEAQIGHVARGETVQLQVPAYPDQPFTGVVTAVAPSVDQRSRSVSVRVQPKDDGGKLLSGMLAQVSFVTAQKPSALVIPRTAISGTPSPNAQAQVVTIDNGGKVQRAAIQLGLVTDTQAEVVSGLAEGQLVAASNAAGLNDGDIVVPQVETRTALAR